MKNKRLKVGIFLLALILIGGVIYFLLIKKQEEKPKEYTIPKEKEIAKGLTKEDSKDYKNGFYVYYDKDEEMFCFYDDKSKCSDKKVFIKTESDDIKRYFEFEDKYYFYKDNGKIKVYDNDTKGSFVINIKEGYFSYNFEVDDLTKEFVGIIYSETDESGASYYSVVDDKIIYDKNYEEMQFLSKDYLTGTTYDKSKNPWVKTEVSLLSTTENKKLLSHKIEKNADGYYEENQFYQLLRNEKGIYIALSTFIDATIYEEIYNTEFKKIAENIGEYSATVASNGNLHIEKNGVVTAYDKNGEVVKKSKKNTVLQVIDDYIVALVDDKLVLLTLDGDKIELAPWDKSKNEYAHYRTYMAKEKGNHKLFVAVKDRNVTVDQAWDACNKDNKCSIESKDDLINYYDAGYLYYYVKETKEIGKVISYM